MTEDKKNTFSIVAKNFLSAVSAVRKVVISKPVIPALENIRFDVKEGWLTLSASDTETTVSVRRELIEATFEGSFLVLPTFVGDILKGLSLQRLDFEVFDSRLDISWTEGRISVPLFTADEWPLDEGAKGEVLTARMISDDITAALSLVDYACAKDEVRPTLCGVEFSFLGAGKGVTMAASDAHVMAVAEVPRAEADKVFSFVLPKKTAARIKAMLTLSHDVSIMRDDRRVTFTVEDAGITVSGRLAEGKFPNWRAVVPSKFASEASVLRESLLETTLRLGVCAGPGKGLLLSFADGRLAVESRDIGMNADGEEWIPCTMEGEGVKVCFRMDLFRAVLESLPGFKARFYMNDGSSAVVIRDADAAAREDKGEADHDIRFFALMMPITWNN